MKGFHPNPQRDGYNLAGLHWIVAMIKYRRQIVAYTFRKYTRYHIRQLFSNQLSDNNLFLSIKHVALPTGFGCRILNLGNSKSYFVKYLFALKSLSISIGGETMTAQITFPFLQQPPPPPSPLVDFGVEANRLHVLPNSMYILIWTSEGQTGSIHFWTVR